jgi:4-azaleucine resistance transporter AzlC
MSTSTPVTAAADAAPRPRDALPRRSAIVRAAGGIGVYAAAFGFTFGAVATASGLHAPQAVALSVVLFSGASQFALVGVLAAGGAPVAALSTALLLGARNAFYGLALSPILRPRGWRRLLGAQLVIDESAAMTLAQPAPCAGRFAFWATGISIFVLWNLGTIAGTLVGSGIDTSALGLDAAAPAIFLALLWPQLARRRARPVALAAVAVTLSLVTVAPAGVPIIAAAVVAVAGGLLPERRREDPERRREDPERSREDPERSREDPERSREDPERRR